MSDQESQQGSEGEHNVRVLEAEWRYGATLHIDEEDIETKKVYTPLRLLVKRKMRNPSKPPMAASRNDRLTFFRAYTTTPSKSYFICWRNNVVSDVIYMSILFNTALSCLSVYFIQIFLGVFAPEHHLYITKMVPLFYGISVMYLFTAILELTRLTDVVMIFIDYFSSAVFLLLPWNSCKYEEQFKFQVTYNNKSYNFKCLTLPEFTVAHSNLSEAVLRMSDRYSCYIHEEMGTCNQISQIAFITKRDNDIQTRPLFVLGYFLLIWTGCVIWYKQVFRAGLYKLMNITQIIGNIFFLFFFLHINFISDVQNVPRKKVVTERDYQVDNQAYLLWDITQLIVAAITISPPILHLLSARCEKVKPNPDSFFMTLGNVLLLLYRAWINTCVHAHVDKLFNGFIVECVIDSAFIYPCLYYWLIFFASLQLGNFYCLIFLLVNMITEYLTLIVTFHCVIEVYASEIKLVNRLVVTVFIYLVSLSLYMLIYNERRILSHFCRVIIFTLECVAIFAMYPLPRLLDDLTFYYGVHPSKIRYLSTLVIPFTDLLIIAAVVMYGPMDLNSGNHNKFTIYTILLLFMGLPFISGMVYTVVKFIRSHPGKLQEWTQLFCPVREWGPTNFIARQLRKQFDSHEFVASQAPRILSRYLMKNAEPESYKLDIIYESSLDPTFEEEYEKKKLA